MTSFLLRLGKRALLPLAMAVLPACTLVGPDFTEPRPGWLDSWESDLHGLVGGGGETAGGSDLRFWWRLFEDPVLDRLIETVRRENRDLRIAALRIFESRALLGIAGSGLYPQVQEITGAATWSDSRNSETPAQDGSRTRTQAGFNIAWELDFWGRYRRSIESADAAFFAAVENRRAVQVLITAQTVDLYYRYRVTRARIDIARRNAAIQKRSFDIATEQYKSGNTSELDMQQARTQYLGTLAVIPPLESLLVQIRNALCVLMNRPPGPVPLLDEARGDLPRIDPRHLAVVPARLLLRRPDLRATVWQVAAQSAQIGVAKADFYPSIALVGNVVVGASSAVAGTTTGLTAGPTLRWNIFNYGRIENNVRLQDARFQALLEQYQNAVLKAAAEVDNAAMAVRKTTEQVQILKQAVTSAERAVAIAHTSYQEGYNDFQRVLDAQRSLFSQNDRLMSSVGENIAAVIGLYKSLGGGWSPTPADAMLPAETVERMKRRVDWGRVLDAPLPSPPPPATRAPAPAGPPATPDESP